MLLVGVIGFAVVGSNLVLWAVALGCIAGIGVALARDAGVAGVYVLEGDRLVLQARKDREVIAISDVMDVSLIDRAGARDYILSSLTKGKVFGYIARRRAAKRFVRFATVDIGLTSYTFGLGRQMIDRMPDARKDLVLLRLRNGTTHILSPEYNQELISAVSRQSLRITSDQE